MIRNTNFAGSWYSDDPSILLHQIKSSLEQNPNINNPNHPKVLIGPHAGYKYSLKTLGILYSSISNPLDYTKIVLLGPSHRLSLDKCALSTCDSYQTPLGPITLDTKLISELRSTNLFKTLSLNQEEAEHSLELHLPIIKHVFPQCSLIPIMVGNLNQEYSNQVRLVLMNLMKDERVLFVVSSDFCHWGSRFGYSPTPPAQFDYLYYLNSFSKYYVNTTKFNHTNQESKVNSVNGGESGTTIGNSGSAKDIQPREKTIDNLNNFKILNPLSPKSTPISQFIQSIDFDSILAIAENKFDSNLKATKNTICGRNCILLILNVLQEFPTELLLLDYEQSGPVFDEFGSSVSYAAIQINSTIR